MSFRTRLTLFFLLIVALPMVALAVLVVNVADDSRTGKTDAALSADLDVASADYRDRIAAAEGVARQLATRLAADPATEAALRAEDSDALGLLAREIAREQRLAALRIESPEGRVLVELGSRDAIAPASIELLSGDDGAAVGRLTVSTTSGSDYLHEVREATGEEVALLAGGGRVAGTVPIDESAVPEPGNGADVEVGGETLRIAATQLPGGEGLRLAVLAPSEDESFLSSSPAVAGGLVLFFVFALLVVVWLTRTLHGQIRVMLDAARRLGAGDFSREVPVVGKDEMAGLASEFNKMSGRLAEQMDELRRQRLEIDRSVQRVGAAFASGLDRHRLLEIIVETAVAACEAEYGLVVLSGHVGEEVETGDGTEKLREVALTAEHRALREGGLIEVEEDGAHALASSLGQISASGPVGVMSIARAAAPFTKAQRDVFAYLLAQATTSVENVALHELVSGQAATDELTGLANNRAFRETMEKEAARAARFGHDLSLLILDIDDFKLVNDTYGHLQGDVVLRLIGEILRAESREIDEPARYGGEEFVVALPETGTEGAVEVAERIRERIEAQSMPLLNGEGAIRVTASLGAATTGGLAPDPQALIAAADAALYEAKRDGKNRLVVARLDAAASPAGSTDRPG